MGLQVPADAVDQPGDAFATTTGDGLQVHRLRLGPLRCLVEVFEAGVGLPTHPGGWIVVEQQPSPLGHPSGDPERGVIEDQQVDVVRQLQAPPRRCVGTPPGGDIKVAAFTSRVVGAATVDEGEARTCGTQHRHCLRLHVSLGHGTMVARERSGRRERPVGRTIAARAHYDSKLRQ
jgi:hypothetical protein